MYHFSPESDSDALDTIYGHSFELILHGNNYVSFLKHFKSSSFHKCFPINFILLMSLFAFHLICS